MKYKFLKLSTLLILTGLLSTVATAANESEQSVGMCLGHVYSTDIVTYVDGMPIISYNIGGKTVIAAKDLMEYGFQVNWSEEDRTVFITSGRYPEQKPAHQPAVDTPGRILGNIYQSDIRVFVNNQEIPSYNIGGQTMIAPSDMSTSNTNNFEQCNLNQKLGYSNAGFRTEWDASTRTVKITSLRPGSEAILQGDIYTVSELTSDFYLQSAGAGVISSQQETWADLRMQGLALVVGDQEYFSLELLQAALWSGGVDTDCQLIDGTLVIHGELAPVLISPPPSAETNDPQHSGYGTVFCFGAHKGGGSAALAKLLIPIKWIDNDGDSEEFTVDGYIAGSADRSDNYFFLDLAQIFEKSF